MPTNTVHTSDAVITLWLLCIYIYIYNAFTKIVLPTLRYVDPVMATDGAAIMQRHVLY